MYYINHMEEQLRCQAHQMRVRTRLLHTCILYLSIIVCKIYKKVASQPGLLGSLASTFPLALAVPILHAIQCCILAMASFADDKIITCENRIQQLLPPSSYLFDMLEWIVLYLIDTLPAKFDEATHVAELLIEGFSREERSSSMMEEKEIVVDSNSTQSGLGACSSLVNGEEKAMVGEKLYNSLHQCEENEPADKVKLIEWFTREKRTSCLVEEKEIVMNSNCTQSALGACGSLVNDKEEKAMVDEELYNSLYQCEEYKPADKLVQLIEWFSREKRTSCLVEEKEIVMDSNCTQIGLDACGSLVNDKEEKAMVDKKLCNSLHQCEEYEPADKVKRLDALEEEEKKAAKRKGGKKKRQDKIVEVEVVPHDEMEEDGEKHQISDGVGEGKESAEGIAKCEYNREGLAKCEYKKEDEGDRILHLFEQGWSMRYCL